MRSTHLHLAHRPNAVALYQNGTAADALALDAHLFGPGAGVETREATALPFSPHGYREALTLLCAPGSGRTWRLGHRDGPHSGWWVCEVVGAGFVVRGVGHSDWLAMGLAVGEVRRRMGARS